MYIKILDKEGIKTKMRLDKYISEKSANLTRMKVQRMIEEGKILVNGKKVKPSYNVEESDEIEIQEEILKEGNILPQDIPLDILYEDSDILVVNKPKGMVVHPGNGNEEGTLANAVMAYCKESLSGIRWRYKTRDNT